jgi:hypothetical protein
MRAAPIGLVQEPDDDDSVVIEDVQAKEMGPKAFRDFSQIGGGGGGGGGGSGGGSYAPPP